MREVSQALGHERGALNRDVTIRRQLETGYQQLAYDVWSPLRLLVIVSRPDNAGFIDPRHSSRAMLDALTSLEACCTSEVDDVAFRSVAQHSWLSRIAGSSTARKVRASSSRTGSCRNCTSVAAPATPPAGLPDPLPQLIAKILAAAREAGGG